MSLLQKYYFCITISKDNNMFVFPVCHHFQPWLILPMIALYIDAKDLLKLHSNIYISTISQDILKLSSSNFFYLTLLNFNRVFKNWASI